MRELMAGMDLHSNNVMIGIVDREGKRILHKRTPCELPAVLEALEPYRERIDTVAVESTYNWYWLIDGLAAKGYSVRLANAAGIAQYRGIKHTDDTSDAYFIAELLRLGILPLGHIYDAEIRPLRDLVRRRMSLVQKRTSLLLGLMARTRAGTTARTAIGTWRGRLLRRPTLHAVWTLDAGGSSIERKPQRTRSWRPRRWPVNLPKRRGGSCTKKWTMTRNGCFPATVA